MEKEYDDNFKESEIQRLEGEISEFNSELKYCREKELIYQEILSEINNSLIELLKREEENTRFRFDEKIDYRQYVVNLKRDLDEYKRIYRKTHF